MYCNFTSSSKSCNKFCRFMRLVSCKLTVIIQKGVEIGLICVFVNCCEDSNRRTILCVLFNSCRIEYYRHRLIIDINNLKEISMRKYLYHYYFGETPGKHIIAKFSIHELVLLLATITLKNCTQDS